MASMGRHSTTAECQLQLPQVRLTSDTPALYSAREHMAALRSLLPMATRCGAAALAQGAAMITFDFEADHPGNPPRGFELALTGKGRPGHWVVVEADDAPSGRHVLAQDDGDTTDYRFPIAFTGPVLENLRLSVKCKPVAGKVDQGCGLIWRVKDPDNYYIARANALEDNVHLYR